MARSGRSLLSELLLRDNQTIPLAPKAFDTLLLLVENSGHLLTKDELMKRLWPETFVEEVNLAQNISVIRRALDDKNGGGQYIETVPKGGYRFVGPVSVSQPTAPDSTSAREAIATSAPRCIWANQTLSGGVSFWALPWVWCLRY